MLPVRLIVSYVRSSHCTAAGADRYPSIDFGLGRDGQCSKHYRQVVGQNRRWRTAPPRSAMHQHTAHWLEISIFRSANTLAERRTKTQVARHLPMQTRGALAVLPRTPHSWHHHKVERKHRRPRSTSILLRHHPQRRTTPLVALL